MDEERDLHMPRHSPCKVRDVNRHARMDPDRVFLVGPDREQLFTEFMPDQLAVAEEAGWLPLHYAVALGCEEVVVAALLEAHREVSAWQWWEGGVLLQ